LQFQLFEHRLGGRLDASAPQASALRYRNTYGMFGDGKGSGVTAINAYFPDVVVTNNVIYGPSAGAGIYPSGNFSSAKVEDAGFADAAKKKYARISATSAPASACSTCSKRMSSRAARRGPVRCNPPSSATPRHRGTAPPVSRPAIPTQSGSWLPFPHQIPEGGQTLAGTTRGMWRGHLFVIGDN
jgi:hypothetical protein